MILILFIHNLNVIFIFIYLIHFIIFFKINLFLNFLNYFKYSMITDINSLHHYLKLFIQYFPLFPIYFIRNYLLLLMINNLFIFINYF